VAAAAGVVVGWLLLGWLLLGWPGLCPQVPYSFSFSSETALDKAATLVCALVAPPRHVRRTRPFKVRWGGGAGMAELEGSIGALYVRVLRVLGRF
jgi:hypothetical protein